MLITKSMGSMGSAEDKHASHLCEPGSFPILSVSCGLSMLLVLTLLQGFFSEIPAPQKPTLKSNSIHITTDEKPPSGCAVV